MTHEIFKEEENCKEKVAQIMKILESKVEKKADKSRDFRTFLKQQKQGAAND